MVWSVGTTVKSLNNGRIGTSAWLRTIQLEALIYNKCFSLPTADDGAVHRAQEADQSGGRLKGLQRDAEEVCVLSRCYFSFVLNIS